jgi:hypothetical protein
MVANRIGLGNNRSLYVAPKAYRLWKRLWWMCILRDRVIAVATRKPLQFGEGEIGMPLLTVDDFETQPINTDIPLLRACGFLIDPGMRQTFARLCIEKINVSGWAARILAQNYSPSSCSEVPATSVMLYSPKPRLENMAENIDLCRKLKHWTKTLPHDCIFAQSPNNIRDWIIDHQVLYLHRSVLRMFSLMVYGLLYRPLLSAKMNQDYENQFPQHEVRQALEQVANETASIARVFCEQGLVPKLPPFASTFFLCALPTFLVGIQGSTGALYEKLRLQFRWCSEGIYQQRAIWPTSELAYAMVKAMISRARVRDAWGLTSESSLYNSASILPPPSLDLEPGVISYRRNAMDLSIESPPAADLRGNCDGLSAPGEASVDWASWLDFDDGLFNYLCKYSNYFGTD